MKLSIIVPIYKVERYLRRCVDSILAQTFTDYELILVDDGSPDGCPAICDEYALMDSRVKVIHKENGGQSTARNAALQIAEGEYVGFVDSDDYIAPQMYEHMLQVAQEKSAEIVACAMEDVDSEGKHCGTWPPEPRDYVFGKSDFIDHAYPDVRRIIMMSVCNKVIKRSLFDKVRFPEGIICEDSMIQLPLYDQCNTIAVVKECHYKYYYVRPGSSMNSSYSKKNIASVELGYFQWVFFREKNLREQMDYAMTAYVSDYMLNLFGVHRLCPQEKSYFRKFKRQFCRMLPLIVKNPKICKLKKLMIAVSYVNKDTAILICKKYFPECLPYEMREVSVG